jgi:hypothetical protein
MLTGCRLQKMPSTRYNTRRSGAPMLPNQVAALVLCKQRLCMDLDVRQTRRDVNVIQQAESWRGSAPSAGVMLAPPSRGDCRPWSLWPPTLARRREIAFVMTNTCGAAPHVG